MPWESRAVANDIQMLGSLLLFKNSNLLVVTLEKSCLVLTLLLTWNFLDLLLTTTTLQSSKPRNFTTLLCYHQIWLIQKNLWNTINKLLHRIAKPSFPSSFYLNSLPQSFLHFSQIKFTNFDHQFYLAPPLPHHIFLQISNLLSFPFSILQPLLKSPHLLKFSWHFLWSRSNPYLTPQTMQICSTSHNHKYHHLSLSTGVFPDQFKICTSYSQKIQPWQRKLIQLQANISPILPIQTYRRLVKNRLTEHLNENNLMNSFQSAYTKFNSTETTLLAVHDHIIRAVSQQQVTGLCLLDLSAAFDTIDHSILLRIASNLGLDSLKLSYLGFTLTFHLGPSLLISMASNLLPLNFSMVFLKVLFLALFSSFSIQLHSAQ